MYIRAYKPHTWKNNANYLVYFNITLPFCYCKRSLEGRLIIFISIIIIIVIARV